MVLAMFMGLSQCLELIFVFLAKGKGVWVFRLAFFRAVNGDEFVVPVGVKNAAKGVLTECLPCAGIKKGLKDEP